MADSITKEERLADARKALLNYQQADQDGIMVITSRQAIHEVDDALDFYDAMKWRPIEEAPENEWCLIYDCEGPGDHWPSLMIAINRGSGVWKGEGHPTTAPTADDATHFIPLSSIPLPEGEK